MASSKGAKIVDLDDPQVLKQQGIQTITSKKEIVPLGFIPIEMSTGGALGVPSLIHCRNFSTGDLIDLSLFNENALPEQVIPVLNSLIFEEVDVGTWPDKSIIELLVRIYVNYFTPTLKDVDFPWIQEDIDWLIAHGQSDKAKNLQEGVWKPLVILNLTNVNIKSLPDSVKPFVTIRKKEKDGIPTLEMKFLAYPKYGDIITVRKAIEAKFGVEDKKFARIRQQSETKERYLREGKDIGFLEPIDDMEYLKWQMHEVKKAVYTARATQALYLVSFNNIDLSTKTIDEKMQFIMNPLFDVNASKMIEEKYNSLDFGLDPNMDVINPITGDKCTRRFSFRLMDILSAIQSYKPDEYSVSYDD